MEERRGERKRDGQVEMERREARIRAERLDTSQHSKEETQLTRIRDINERTATRAGDLGHVEGGVHVGTGERTQDTPRGGTMGRETLEEWERGRTGTTAGGGTRGCSWGGRVFWEEGSSG